MSARGYVTTMMVGLAVLIAATTYNAWTEIGQVAPPENPTQVCFTETTEGIACIAFFIWQTDE